jgi:mitochondrial fission protein ELM1
MVAENVLRPAIWVLKGVRAGDTAQAMDLALQLGGRVEGKQLAFNAFHNIPNWLLGARVSQLTQDAKKLLHPPWPDLVVATGRRTAPVALWIKTQSQGKTKLVHIGRPRMALSRFDLVLTTPQYGLSGRWPSP